PLGAGIRNVVGAVAKQTLLSMLEIERHIDGAAFERERSRHFIVNCFDNFQATFGALFLPWHNMLVGGDRGRLVLRSAPGGDHTVCSNLVQRISTGEDSAAKNGPGDRSANKYENDGGNSFSHYKTPLV